VPQPIAFVVMPFRTKPTGVGASGVPAEVDFDALWQRVYFPLLTRLGYQAVRADSDVGGLIISEMIQRLALADLVVADLTLPNANVYYEVGVRHAAKRVGCVLVAADWSKPLFDLQQIRQLRFPLPDGTVGDAAAETASDALAEGLAALGAGTSPVFDSVEGFPDAVDVERLSAFRDLVTQLSAFEADVRTARLAPIAEQKTRALEVYERHKGSTAIRESVAFELLRLLRDLAGWEKMLEFIETLREELARDPFVREQRALGLAKLKDFTGAAAELEQLIADEGPTPERLGLLGGRYKELYRAAQVESDRQRYLNRAIDSYRQGMLLDLNGYYNSSNLPRLYRARAGDDDGELAHEASSVTLRACNRAIELGIADEWARPTLLGYAFDRGDVAEAQRIVGEVEREGAEAWKLESTLADLVTDVGIHEDTTVQAELQGVLDRLTDLLAAHSTPEPVAQG
jgi:t-SNARE complex subunit (syntaxin)